MFDIRLNEEQRAFQQMAREFAQTEIKPIALELDRKPSWEDRIPWEVLKKGSQLGFRTFVLSEENGGAGASDQLTACVVAEELAAGDIGTAYYYMLTARRARDWFEIRATQEQRDYFIPRFIEDGTYFTTVAIHEPDTDFGFDYYTDTPPDVKLKTRATQRADGSWVINGAKNFQTVGYLAKLIVTMAQTDEAGDILFLHADTMFVAKPRETPRTVRGRDYDLTGLLRHTGIPDRVQFVWHGVNDAATLETFLSSPLQWCEADVRTDPYGALVLRRDSFCERAWCREEEPLRFEHFVDRTLRHGKSMKLDLEGGAASLDRILGTLCMHGAPAERLWFNGDIEDLGEDGMRLIRAVFPGAAIQCPVDFLAPVIRAVPDRAEETLQTLAGWGIDRFSLSWKTERKHRIFAMLDEWGFAVNIYDVPDLRAFLEAALLLPRSLTARFADQQIPNAEIRGGDRRLPQLAASHAA